jgi:hypothetical protein
LAWFLPFIRMCLGGQLFIYGVAKAIPTQMPDPPLAALLEPFGELSPTSAPWQQVGSSHPYEILLGAAEVAAGLLIFWPRTATLSAMANMLVLQRSSDSATRRRAARIGALGADRLHTGRLAKLVHLRRPGGPSRSPSGSGR